MQKHRAERLLFRLQEQDDVVAAWSNHTIAKLSRFL